MLWSAAATIVAIVTLWLTYILEIARQVSNLARSRPPSMVWVVCVLAIILTSVWCSLKILHRFESRPFADVSTVFVLSGGGLVFLSSLFWSSEQSEPNGITRLVAHWPSAAVVLFVGGLAGSYLRYHDRLHNVGFCATSMGIELSP